MSVAASILRFAAARNGPIIAGGKGVQPLSDNPAEPTIDLGFVGQALQRLTTEVASLRDDMHVLTAIVMRLDNSQGRMLEELRGMHRQYSRVSERVRQLEEQR